MSPPFVSVIINNYNYESFLKKCIESALSQTYPHKEVIVVDDGSTDDSRAVITSFGPRITPFFNPNGGQFTAYNTGFQACRGDWVMFLDSDDFLGPQAIENASRFFPKPNTSKIQFCMQWVDEKGNFLPKVNPSLKNDLSPDQIRYWYYRSAAYPCSPGSGNLYRRDFLKDLFPLDDSCLIFGDSVLLACAVVAGDIYTVKDPLVFYRKHGKNATSASNVGHSFYARETKRALLRFQYAQGYAKKHRKRELSPMTLHRGLHFLQLRASSMALCGPEHPFRGDHSLLLCRDALRAFFTDQPLGWFKRLLALSYIFLISLAPPCWAPALASYRYHR